MHFYIINVLHSHTRREKEGGMGSSPSPPAFDDNEELQDHFGNPGGGVKEWEGVWEYKERKRIDGDY